MSRTSLNPYHFFVFAIIAGKRNIVQLFIALGYIDSPYLVRTNESNDSAPRYSAAQAYWNSSLDNQDNLAPHWSFMLIRHAIEWHQIYRALDLVNAANPKPQATGDESRPVMWYCIEQDDTRVAKELVERGHDVQYYTDTRGEKQELHPSAEFTTALSTALNDKPWR